MRSKRLEFQIFHLATDKQCEVPRKVLEVASIRCPEKFGKPIMRPMFEVQYHEFRTKVSRKVNIADDNHHVMLFANGRYMLISEVLEILKENSCPTIILNQPQFEPSWTSILFDDRLVNSERDYIFFNIHIGGRHAGYLIIEVFTDINPKISKSFVNLFQEDIITIGHYLVFKEGWLEFGIAPRKMPMRGHNHHPTMSHNRRGIISFCEEFNTECDPFFIHFVPCTFFDDLRTVLGRVVHGDHILTKIEQLETEFGKIEKQFSIHACGIVPIGRNVPEDLDEEDWEKSIHYLFGTKYTPLYGGGADDYSDIICPMYPLPKGEESESISEPSTYSTPQTIQSWTDFDPEPLTLIYSEDTPEYLTEQSTSRDISVKSDDSLKQPYSSELTLHGEFPSHDPSNEIIICNDNQADSDDESSVKSNQCPSLGVDYS